MSNQKGCNAGGSVSPMSSMSMINLGRESGGGAPAVGANVPEALFQKRTAEPFSEKTQLTLRANHAYTHDVN